MTVFERHGQKKPDIVLNAPAPGARLRSCLTGSRRKGI